MRVPVYRRTSHWPGRELAYYVEIDYLTEEPMPNEKVTGYKFRDGHTVSRDTVIVVRAECAKLYKKKCNWPECKCAYDEKIAEALS